MVRVASYLSYFRIVLDCQPTAGDPFETFLPLAFDIYSETRVLPPQLVAGERFSLRFAYIGFDSGGSGANITWLTMRDEDDGALLFALNTRQHVPEAELLERLSLTAEDWLAPIAVSTVSGICPTVPDDGTERFGLDITVPGQDTVRLVDRNTAYLGDTYFLELGTFAVLRDRDGGLRRYEETMIVAADVCPE